MLDSFCILGSIYVIFVMRKVSVWVFVLFVVLCNSCKEKVSYPEILREAEKVMDTNPDSASVLLSEILNPGELTDAEKADYGYLTALAHFSIDKAMAEDGVIIYTLSYYKDHNVADKLAQTYMLAAEYYGWNNNLQMAVTMLNGGLDFSLEIQDSTWVSRFYRAIGQDYYSKKEYKEAISFFHQAVDYEENNGVDYQIGLSYAFLGNVDSMNYYINKAIDYAGEQGEHDVVRHYRRNYADILYHCKKYREALHIQKQIADAGGSSWAVTTSIALLYLAMRQPDSARIYIDSTRVHIKEMKKKEPDATPDMSADNFVLALQAVVDYAGGRLINLQSMGAKNHEYWAKARNNELLIEEKVELKNKLEQQNLLLTIARQRLLLYIAWGMILFISVAVCMFLYIRRKRTKLIEAEEKREILEKLLKEATAVNEKDSAFFKKVLLQQLGLIKLVASTPTNHNQELLKQVSLINNSDVQTEDMLVWVDLYKLIDSIYDGFYSKMISKHGILLTEKEKQLCCLLCAGFSTKEISVISQQSVQTIYQRKTVIRQKLKMDEKEDIIDFIKT